MLYLRQLLIIGMVLLTPGAQSEDVQRTMTLNLNNADIRALISTVSEMTGKNFVVDPRVKGKVSVVSATPVSTDRIYEIFLSVLKVHGFSAVESGDVIKIVPTVTAKQDNIETVVGIHPGISDGMITRVVEVHHADAIRLVPILRPLLPQSAHLAAHPDSNTLVITDSAANVSRIVGIIERIDQSNNRGVEIIQLKHSQAQDLQATLNSLSRGSTGAPDGGKQAPSLIADTRTNSLILDGDPSWRRSVRELIEQLDVPLVNEDDTDVIYLQYASAGELVEVLRGVGTQQLASSTGGEAAKSASGQGSRFDIQADEATNALVVTAPPFLMRSLKDVIDRLDIRRAQVQIEAIVAEMDYDKSVDLGIDWQSTIPGTGWAATTKLNSDADLSGIGGSSDAYPATPGSGLTLGYLSSGNLRALIRALAGDANTNVLSTPSLVTLDNEEATIHVGKNVPFVTGRYSDDTSSNPFETIERHDTGIKLTVTPQINEGDTIKLKLEQEVSSVDADDRVTSDIVTKERSIKTTVLVDNGDIIVLGGLIESRLNETIQKVPVLGDIPLLGMVFQNRSTGLEKQNLMVFIRPEIIRDRPTGNAVTAKKYDEIRNLQLKAAKEGIDLIPGETPPVLPAREPEHPKIPEAKSENEGHINPFYHLQHF